MTLAHRLSTSPARRRQRATGSAAEALLEAQAKTIPAKRFGTPKEFGAICTFLCSQHAGYLTGQNILADGGAYPGTF